MKDASRRTRGYHPEDRAVSPLPSVLFAASECAPFAKSGGLGDVVGALPIALRERGHDVRVVLPRYGFIDTRGMRRHEAPLGVPLGASEAWCAVYETTLPGSDVPLYLIEHDALFARPYLYDPVGGWSHDNFARFTCLSRASLQLCKYLGFIPDVVHVHDWPTALVPVLLNTVEASGPLAATATVLTVHNLAYQPHFAAAELDLAGVGWGVFQEQGLADQGAINPLKGGLWHATMLTTVSPRYADEVRTPAMGAGLDHVLRYRGADLVGILNGIDERVWDPRADPHLPAPFDAADLSGKTVCKRALQDDLGLAPEPLTPIVGIIARLAEQKGIDLVLACLDRLLALDLQLAVLGAGDPALERELLAAAATYPGRVGVRIGFDERIAHRIEAGADMFLMPSRFEPCGLNQMYSQRYGTLPIVHAVGGLDDTVEDFDPARGTGTGFKFHPATADTVLAAVDRACEVWSERPLVWRAMQRRAMTTPFGWDRAAERYDEVYRWALERRRWW